MNRSRLATMALAAPAFAALLPSAGAAVFDPYAAPANRGPSSLDVPGIGSTSGAPGTPYLLPTATGWSATSLLTTGNVIGGYTMVGIPDGLGAYASGRNTITVLMNHEVAATSGRGTGNVGGASGSGATQGGFVSQWTIDRNSLQVISGRDFVNTPANFNIWDQSQNKYVTGAEIKAGTGTALPASVLNLGRLCSADLPAASAFYNVATGKGYNGQIFLNGEEGATPAGIRNRAFGWVTGAQTAYELPAFARAFANASPNSAAAFENLLANPHTGDKTVVMANSDGGTNQVAVYIGTKNDTGATPVDRAGLNNGQLYGIRIGSFTAENRDTNVGLTKGAGGLGTGTTATVSLVAPNQGTTLLRPEDGAWDPRNPNRYFFVTTDRQNLSAPGQNVNPDGTSGNGQVGRSRLWSITFDDVANMKTDGTPTGRIELLLDGREGGDMYDNITIDERGVITLNEDTGNTAHNAKIWTYDTNTGQLTQVFKHDPAKFGDLVNAAFTLPTAPFTTDKETSGVLDVTALFRDAAWYRGSSRVLLTVQQAHFPYPTTDAFGAQLVEGGQLLLLVQDIPEPTTLALLGAGLLGLGAMRRRAAAA